MSRNSCSSVVCFAGSLDGLEDELELDGLDDEPLGLDEEPEPAEPDVDPANDIFSIGSGKRYYNVYPLFHTASVYDGIRRDYGDAA